jgi:capsular exopolysaccharide synthesis family protein
MSKQQSNITALVLPATGTESPAASNVIKKYLFHWPLFVVGVVLAMAGAYIYLKKATPVYPITATLKFKTPTSASGTPLTIKEGSLNDLDPATSPIIVENEIEVMQSKKLIYQIVKDLQLWVNYTEKKGWATTDLYNKTPVNFNFLDSNISISPRGEKMEVVIRDENSFEMADTSGVNKVYKYGTPVKSSFGTWQLEATPNLGNYIGSKITIKLQDPDLLSDSYQKGIKVELENKDAPFIHLSMSDQVPARGKDILNSLIALYRFNAQQEKNEQTQKLQVYLSAKVDSLRQELDEDERTLEQFKRNRGITDLDKQADNYRNITQSNASAINDVNVRLRMLESLENYANAPSNSEKLPAVAENLYDASLITLYNRLAELQLERQQKLAITPEANPLFASLDMQISTLKDDIREKIKALKAALLANKNQFQSFDTNVKSSLNTIPNQQKEYNALKREQENKETLYKFLLSKREEINLHFASLIQDSDVVDDAHAGAMKWPKASIVYGLALILGLGAAAGLIYVRENLNDRVTSRKQIEEETEVPILGELSFQETNEPIVVSAGRSKFAIGEQFRVLRTNLYHLHGSNESGRVTLFTSSVSGEGKSFVSANLAVTLAYASRKTIILEMDLRKPKVSAIFGLSPEYPGISNYLAGESDDLSAMIRPSGIKGLDVLSCGAILPNPSELLAKEKLDELINTLKDTYDDIIIDSPPIHLVTDALIIARVADAALYVVRQDYTHKNEFEFIKEINTSNRFKKFTIVFNGVKKDMSGYGYGYSSYNHYNSYADNEKETIGSNVKEVLRRF